MSEQDSYASFMALAEERRNYKLPAEYKDGNAYLPDYTTIRFVLNGVEGEAQVHPERVAFFIEEQKEMNEDFRVLY